MPISRTSRRCCAAVHGGRCGARDRGPDRSPVHLIVLLGVASVLNRTVREAHVREARSRRFPTEVASRTVRTRHAREKVSAFDACGEDRARHTVDDLWILRERDAAGAALNAGWLRLRTREVAAVVGKT